MAKNFATLKEKMRPEAREAAELKALKYRHEMALDELRVALAITQESLAGVLGVKQSTVSKVERQTDMYLSTLQGIIKAMGGELRVEAVFPDGTVELNQFKEQIRRDRRERREERLRHRTQREDKSLGAVAASA